MNYKAFEEFCKLNKIKYQINEPMSEHTSFKIGGPADFFVNVASNSQLKDALLKLKELEIPYFIIGKGSNLLVSDKGIEGAVISLSLIDDIKVEDDVISAGAGASLAAVCVAAANNSLSGLEFAYGIPASVGGALYMNAGAYGGEMLGADSFQLEPRRLSRRALETLHLGTAMDDTSLIDALKQHSDS